MISVKKAQAMVNLSTKATNDLIKLFVEKDILLEVTGFQRNRIFIFADYLNLFKNEGQDEHE